MDILIGFAGFIILTFIMFSFLIFGVIVEIIQAHKKEDYQRIRYIFGGVAALIFFVLLFASVALMSNVF